MAKLTADRYASCVEDRSVSKQDADNAARRARRPARRRRVGAGERPAAAQLSVRADRRAVRRRDHRAQHGRRPADRRGQQRRHRPRALPHRLDRRRCASSSACRRPQSRGGGAGPARRRRVAERPGQTLRGKIVRNASAIDPATRTLLVEVDLDNAKGEILPGAYAQVHLKLPTATPTLLLPVSALMFRAEGPASPRSRRRTRRALVPVTLGRDFGDRSRSRRARPVRTRHRQPARFARRRPAGPGRRPRSGSGLARERVQKEQVVR